MTAASSFVPAGGHLLVALLCSIGLIVLLIAWLKLHPFLALLLGATTLALAVGQPVPQIFTSFAKGFGATTGSVGILIALGAILGKLLAESGGADVIVETLLPSHQNPWFPWAMALIATVLGLPLFFEVGLVLLMPVILLVSRRSHTNLIAIGIPALAGLSVLHGLVPPHPGPLVAVHSLQANLGLTLLLGVVVAIPTVILAGPLLAGPLSRWVYAKAPEALASTFEAHHWRLCRPGFGLTLTTLLLPGALMLGKAVAEIFLAPGTLREALSALGDPVPAMLISTLFAMLALGRAARMDRAEVSRTVASSLPAVAGILLIVGAGGGFKQTILDTGIAATIAEAAQGAAISPLLLGWVLAVLVRLATGSATVATITAAAMVAPLSTGMPPVEVSLLVLAVGSGSLFFSHLNDAGFWMVKEYFGMSVGQTLRTWSLMETVISVVGLVLVLLLDLLL